MNKELRDFIEANAFMSRKHVEFKHPVGGRVHLYVRCAFHMCDHERLHCFDIAGVDIEHQGRGTFKTLLTELEAYLRGLHHQTNVPASFDALFIESILNLRLLEHFKKRPGYRIMSQNQQDPLAPYNAYLRLSPKETNGRYPQ